MKTNPLDNSANSITLASLLAGKTIKYHAHHSKVKDDCIRFFKIEQVEDIATSKKTGERYVRAEVKDLDDNGENKFRCLHLSGIELVV